MPESNQNQLSTQVLERIARFLRGLSPEEIEDLAGGQARLTLEHVRGRKHGAEVPLDIDSLVKDLLAIRSREAGIRLLDDRRSTKAELLALARALDAPVLKSDTVKLLRERIVEASVGYRLRSEAIRGVEEKSGKQRHGTV